MTSPSTAVSTACRRISSLSDATLDVPGLTLSAISRVGLGARAARRAPGRLEMRRRASARHDPAGHGAGAEGAAETSTVEPAQGDLGTASGSGFAHHPVMLAEVTALFDAVPAGLIVDATVGGGGHAAANLAANPRLELVGCDQDGAAVAAAGERLRPFGTRARVVQARFDELARVVAEDHASSGERPVVGVLFDLGVSSHQLDVAERGFSYRTTGPLDMRMDRRGGTSAADLVNTADEGSLTELLVANGEGRNARRLARAIVAARPLSTTTQLADVVARATPAAGRRRGHPARRVFQALRVAVNDELSVLPVALDSAIDLLSPRGRCVVLAYHSGEDRIVKERFRNAATGGCVCPPGLPCVCGAQPTVTLLTRGARKPSNEEVAANPRAEAARLRAVERLDPSGGRR